MYSVSSSLPFLYARMKAQTSFLFAFRSTSPMCKLFSFVFFIIRPFFLVGPLSASALFFLWFLPPLSSRLNHPHLQVIATGSSTAHIRAIADAVAREARAVAGTRPEGACFDVQGRDSDDWMLVDLQQVAYFCVCVCVFVLELVMV